LMNGAVGIASEFSSILGKSFRSILDHQGQLFLEKSQKENQ